MGLWIRTRLTSLCPRSSADRATGFYPVGRAFESLRGHMVTGTGTAAALVLGYLARVANQRDVSGVDELVSPRYVGSGHGWPADRDALREFYRWQARTRPDWLIEVQDVVSVGSCVVIRAHAGGTVSHDQTEAPLAAPTNGAVEWLAAYTVAEGQITAIELLAIRDR